MTLCPKCGSDDTGQVAPLGVRQVCMACGHEFPAPRPAWIDAATNDLYQRNVTKKDFSRILECYWRQQYLEN